MLPKEVNLPIEHPELHRGFEHVEPVPVPIEHEWELTPNGELRSTPRVAFAAQAEQAPPAVAASIAEEPQIDATREVSANTKNLLGALGVVAGLIVLTIANVTIPIVVSALALGTLWACGGNNADDVRKGLLVADSKQLGQFIEDNADAIKKVGDPSKFLAMFGFGPEHSNPRIGFGKRFVEGCKAVGIVKEPLVTDQLGRVQTRSGFFNAAKMREGINADRDNDRGDSQIPTMVQ